jgi:hypothetical protein
VRRRPAREVVLTSVATYLEESVKKTLDQVARDGALDQALRARAKGAAFRTLVAAGLLRSTAGELESEAQIAQIVRERLGPFVAGAGELTGLATRDEALSLSHRLAERVRRGTFEGDLGALRRAVLDVLELELAGAAPRFRRERDRP